MEQLLSGAIGTFISIATVLLLVISLFIFVAKAPKINEIIYWHKENNRLLNEILEQLRKK